MKHLEYMTEPELKSLLNECANAVMSTLRKRTLPPLDGGDHRFVLVVFDDPKMAQYISSCRREDMIKAIRETAVRLEAKEDVPR